MIFRDATMARCMLRGKRISSRSWTPAALQLEGTRSKRFCRPQAACATQNRISPERPQHFSRGCSKPCCYRAEVHGISTGYRIMRFEGVR